jgi:membrane-associated phospholipid phosphatase
MLINPCSTVWKTYFFWAFWVGIAFFSIYPTCNWLSTQRSHTFNLYFTAELSIPFVPEFIWVYFSMYLLFLLPPCFLGVADLKVLGKQLISATLFSCVIFLLFPAKLGFERSIPQNPLYESIFAKLFAIDMPYNLVPSLHVVFSALIVLVMTDTFKTVWGKFVCWGWLSAICLSTLLVHQHHLLDLFAGLVVAWLFRYLLKKEKVHV